jgi:hypothetical protein
VSEILAYLIITILSEQKIFYSGKVEELIEDVRGFKDNQ